MVDKYEVLLERFKNCKAQEFILHTWKNDDEEICWIVEGDELRICDIGIYQMKPFLDDHGIPIRYEFIKTHDANWKCVRG